MLTADLAMSFRRGEQLRPRQLRRDDVRYLRVASDLIALFREHEERERRELDDALREYVGTGTDYRVLRGLIKLLTDRCRFDTAAEFDPVEVRCAVFLAAREHHPVTGGQESRLEVARQASAALPCDAETALESLYADLPGEQRLLEFEPLSAEELIDLYNLAQAQALLYRCVELRLKVEPQTAEGYRELFGAIKAYRLIHTISGDAARGYDVTLSGPVSMFHRSQKYGVQMAVFLPALLACKGWRMRAEVNDGRGGAAFFELDSRQNVLRSPLEGVRGYENPVVERFAETWAAREGEWTLEPSAEVVTAGASVLVPDFVITHPQGRVFYLEILGFWTPEHLRRRLEELERAGARNFLLAAWEELRGSRDPYTQTHTNVVVFKRSLDPAIIRLAIEKLHEQGA